MEINTIRQSDLSAEGSWILTSLCPILGKMYAQEYTGVCPYHFQEPIGKTLNISFIGTPPYINTGMIGGSEFIIANLLAQKFHFIPKFMPAPSADTVQDNNTNLGIGMVDLVSL